MLSNLRNAIALSPVCAFAVLGVVKKTFVEQGVVKGIVMMAAIPGTAVLMSVCAGIALSNVNRDNEVEQLEHMYCKCDPRV